MSIEKFDSGLPPRFFERQMFPRSFFETPSENCQHFLTLRAKAWRFSRRINFSLRDHSFFSRGAWFDLFLQNFRNVEHGLFSRIPGSIYFIISELQAPLRSLFKMSWCFSFPVNPTLNPSISVPIRSPPPFRDHSACELFHEEVSVAN